MVQRTTHPHVEALWRAFVSSRNEESRKCLIEHYWPLVKTTAQPLHAKLPDFVDLDDLISAGAFGLMTAVDGYNPDRGVKFETYSAPRIRGAMLDTLRSEDWVPRLVRRRALELDEAVQELQSRLIRKPTEHELAREMRLSADKFRRVQQRARVTEMVSLDREWADGDSDKSIRYIDMHKDKQAEDPVTVALRSELKEVITRGLSRAERLIILMYYFEEMTMKEIGRTLDMSESRVSQIHSQLLIRLREQLWKRRDGLQAAG